MKAINIYGEAIKRTFADVYQVLPETIDVSWGDNTITVRCSDHTFTHKIDLDETTPSQRFVVEPLFDPARSPVHLMPFVSTDFDKLMKDLLRSIELQFHIEFL